MNKTLIALVVAVPVGAAAVALAGDLNPPVGPPAPTMKTLEEVEPRTIINALNTPGDADSTYRITSPGSYYLVENLDGEPNKHGIEIASEGVKIDLMGFELRGNVTQMGVRDSLSAISTSPAPILQDIWIVNGTISAWGSDGIHIENMGGGPVGNVVLRDLSVNSNAGWGAFLQIASRVERCTVRANDTGGVFTGPGCVIESCILTENSNVQAELASACVVRDTEISAGDLRGIEMGDGSTLDNCRITGGLTGVRGGRDATMIDCSVEMPLDIGIELGGACKLTRVIVHDAGSIGIFVGDDAVLAGCVVSRNGDGIDAAERAVLSGCIASDNAGFGIRVGNNSALSVSVASNNAGGDGIQTGSNCRVRDCVADNNGGRGIYIANDSSAIGCTASSNSDNGIEGIERCIIKDCVAGFNGANGIYAGLHCTVTDCVAGNNANDGITAVTDCLVDRNNCNTNTMHGIHAFHRNMVTNNICNQNVVDGIQVFGDHNRIDGNFCEENNQGIRLNSIAVGNVIVRNQCGANVANNWSIANGNYYGQVVVRFSNSGTGGFTGDSAPSNLGSTDPWANITIEP